MIDTNLLAPIALSIITNFSSTLELPSNVVNSRMDDIQAFAYGGGAFADMYVRHNNGMEFCISGGVISEFRTPGSFRRRENQGNVTAFAGTAIISSNQAVELATRVMGRLAKRGSLISTTKPIVRRGEKGHEEIPFYLISWPSTNTFVLSKTGAAVEIDGRKGTVTFLSLEDKDFFDLPFMEEMLTRATTHDPPPPITKESKRRSSMEWTQPHTNQIESAIKSWSKFCAALGLSVGTHVNIDAVDWNESSVTTLSLGSRVVSSCAVKFQSGICFETLDGVAICHVGSNPYFLGSSALRTLERRKAFTGRINWRWQDLAKDLGTKILNNLQLPRELVAPYRAYAETDRPEVGNLAVKRILLEWRNWPINPGRTVWVDETKQAWEAEFDLETGELIWICFRDVEFLEAVIQAGQRL